MADFIGSDYRFAPVAIPVDLLHVEVEGDGKLSMTSGEPKSASVRGWDKTQKALTPLLHGPEGVKEVMFSRPLTEGLSRHLKASLEGQMNTVQSEATSIDHRRANNAYRHHTKSFHSLVSIDPHRRKVPTSLSPKMEGATLVP